MYLGGNRRLVLLRYGAPLTRAWTSSIRELKNHDDDFVDDDRK